MPHPLVINPVLEGQVQNEEQKSEEGIYAHNGTLL
jgi:hypothetical protein